MSGEGACCANADYSAWGYASGNYPVHCVDCGPQDDEDRILGSVSSMRCLFHAIKAKSRYGLHTDDCQLLFYEPEQINFEDVYEESAAVVVVSALISVLIIAYCVWQSGIQSAV